MYKRQIRYLAPQLRSSSQRQIVPSEHANRYSTCIPHCKYIAWLCVRSNMPYACRANPLRCNGGTTVPYTTAYITHPWGGFPSSMARQPRGFPYRNINLQKALGETFPTPSFWAPTVFQVWRYRPRKTDPGEGVTYTVVYGRTVPQLCPGCFVWPMLAAIGIRMYIRQFFSSGAC